MLLSILLPQLYPAGAYAAACGVTCAGDGVNGNCDSCHCESLNWRRTATGRRSAPPVLSPAPSPVLHSDGPHQAEQVQTTQASMKAPKSRLGRASKHPAVQLVYIPSLSLPSLRPGLTAWPAHPFLTSMRCLHTAGSKLIQTIRIHCSPLQAGKYALTHTCQPIHPLNPMRTMESNASQLTRPAIGPSKPRPAIQSTLSADLPKIFAASAKCCLGCT